MTEAGEAQARRVEAEAAAWTIPDLLSLDRATLDELPVLDLSHLRQGREGAVEELAVQLRKGFKHTGFFMISNHGCEEEVDATMEASRGFHTILQKDQKEAMAFGSRGVGYLKINSRLLPKREKGNMNEAFIVKQEPGPRNITLDTNPFPKESALPGFKDQVLFIVNRASKVCIQLTYYALPPRNQIQASGASLCRCHGVSCPLLASSICDSA